MRTLFEAVKKPNAFVMKCFLLCLFTQFLFCVPMWDTYQFASLHDSSLSALSVIICFPWMNNALAPTLRAVLSVCVFILCLPFFVPYYEEPTLRPHIQKIGVPVTVVLSLFTAVQLLATLLFYMRLHTLSL